MNATTRIGIDVGGSHFSASVIQYQDQKPTIQSSVTNALDSKQSASSFVNAFATFIKNNRSDQADNQPIGIAFPGPFNYPDGICQIYGVGGKFSNLFGLNLKASLQNLLSTQTEIYFANDAHCFALGCHQHLQLKKERAIYITLGTGFGSAFMEDGHLIHDDGRIPEGGAFYYLSFKTGIADEYFSTRWFINEAKSITGEAFLSVKDIVLNNPSLAQKLFALFCENFAAFMIPWLKSFNCEKLIIGGNIAKAKLLFNDQLIQILADNELQTEVLYVDETENMIMMGAAYMADKASYETNFPTKHFPCAYVNKSSSDARKTNQPLLPLTSKQFNQHTIYPSNSIDEISIQAGYISLAKKLSDFKTIKIDGFGGVLWEVFRKNLQKALDDLGIKSNWYSFHSCLKDEIQIKQIIKASLNGDDPVFGKKHEGTIDDFFDEHKINAFNPDSAFDMCIIYGTGASLAKAQAPIVYVDVPKNEIQYRMRAGSIGNFGVTISSLPQQMYKQYYFVDWPILNQHKQKVLSAIDFIVDEQRIDTITWMTGDDFRKALSEIAQKPFRARPWFEPGVWGGQWMKNSLPELIKDEVNYAWSFELITPENGIVITANNFLLEVSFDFLMYHAHHVVLGKATTNFGYEFPIRFDFLDTFDGGNLSIQCHPQINYIQNHFGEKVTQDETYYILDCKDDAAVYLGFQDSIDKEAFREELIAAQKTGKEIDIERYVQKIPSNKHDLYLIPNGTVHASGKNNLVLEISSTPYIFTFKMYDWQRLDLNGQPRPINIDHAFNNLNFERRGKVVEDQLISKQQLIREFEGGEQVKLLTHEAHYYEVERLSFLKEAIIDQNGQCKICMLVEGSEIELIHNHQTQIYRYAETFVIPASAGSIVVKNKGKSLAKIVYAFVKEVYC